MDQESFYQFFFEDDKKYEIGSEDAYVQDSVIKNDIEIGKLFREKIIPNAIDYYLGLVEIEPFSENKEEDDNNDD